MRFTLLVPSLTENLADNPANRAASSSDNSVANNATDNVVTSTASQGGIDPIPPRYRLHEQQYRDAVSISRGGDPYKTKTVRGVVLFVVSYSWALLMAAGAVSALTDLVGFMVVVGLALWLYTITLYYEYVTVLKAFVRYLKK